MNIERSSFRLFKAFAGSRNETWGVVEIMMPTLVAGCYPALRRAAMQTPGASSKMWHDNERFLINPPVYRDHGLQSVRFPPSSGDLNPIENVWAHLRRDMSSREMDDLRVGKYLTVAQYRQRVAQLLNSYAVPVQTKSIPFCSG